MASNIINIDDHAIGLKAFQEAHAAGFAPLPVWAKAVAPSGTVKELICLFSAAILLLFAVLALALFLCWRIRRCSQIFQRPAHQEAQPLDKRSTSLPLTANKDQAAAFGMAPSCTVNTTMAHIEPNSITSGMNATSVRSLRMKDCEHIVDEDQAQLDEEQLDLEIMNVIEGDLEQVVTDCHEKVEKEAKEFEEQLTITEEEKIALEMSLAAEKELERIMKEIQAESQRNMDEKLKLKEDENNAFDASCDIEDEVCETAQGQKQQDNDQKEPKVDATTIPTDVAEEASTIDISRIGANTNGVSEKFHGKTTQPKAPVSELDRAMQRRRQQVDTQGTHFESVVSSARIANFSWDITTEK